MLQDSSDLDFDAYFDVSSTRQQQNKRNASILYHSPTAGLPSTASPPPPPALNITSPLLSMDTRGNNPLSSCAQPNQPPPTGTTTSGIFLSAPNDFDAMLSWDFQGQSPAPPLSGRNTISSPASSTSLSPSFAPGSDFQMHFVKQEADRALAGAYAMPSGAPMSFGFDPVHLGGNMPGIAIPATPHGEPVFSSPATHPSLSPSASSHSSTHLSPLVEGHSLHGAFTAIDHGWGAPMVNSMDPGKPDVDNKEHETRHWRKRNHGEAGDLSRLMEPSRQLKKVAHNAIERRYRNNINDRIQDLKNVVPALYKSKAKEKSQSDRDDGDGDDDDDSVAQGSDDEQIVDGVEVAKKLNKATILRKATEYILYLKHSNTMADRENQILQQIIAQMPGGNQVLSRFLAQKKEFEKAEQERIIQERKEKQEQEQAERQRVLRERAAQRNALAQLMPKPQRQPYRRRKKAPSQNKTQEENDNGTKMFMALFTCLAFFSPSLTTVSKHSGHARTSRAFVAPTFTNHTAYTTPTDLQYYVAPSTVNPWYWLQLFLIAGFAVVYFYSDLKKLLWSPSPRKARPCANSHHHHYAANVATAWSGLYRSLLQVTPMDPKPSPLRLALDVMLDLFSLCIPWRPAVLFKPDQLARSGAWVRTSEIECLGGNDNVSRFQIIRSFTGMFSSVQKLKRDKRNQVFFSPRTRARIYTTAAIQLELALPIWGEKLSEVCWRRVAEAIQSGKDNKDHWFSRARDIDMEHWSTSEGHRQLMAIVRARNGFDKDPDSCRHIFYSFALPYLTSPLDWVLYWQSLYQCQDLWVQYISNLVLGQGKQHNAVFTPSQLPSTIITPVDHMLAWWIHLGIYLQSFDAVPARTSFLYLKEHVVLADKHNQRFQPSSNLLQRHRAMIYHITEAMTAIQSKRDDSANIVEHHLDLAAKDQEASTKCIQQIALLPTANYEATVFLLSTIAVHLQALYTLSRQLEILQMQQKQPQQPQSSTHSFEMSGALVARYLCQLRDQLSQDMGTLTSTSATAKLLPLKCRKQIKSYISKVDDALIA